MGSRFRQFCCFSNRSYSLNTQAVTNPEITARRKIKKNLKKVEAKKRKIDELRPVRKFKKKKLAS